MLLADPAEHEVGARFTQNPSGRIPALQRQGATAAQVQTKWASDGVWV